MERRAGSGSRLPNRWGLSTRHPRRPGSSLCLRKTSREGTASACNLIDDDFAGSSDEVKIFKDEGEDEEKEYVSQEELQAALSEDKSSLIQETELSIKQEAALRLTDSTIGKLALPERQNHRKSRIQHSKFVKNAQSGPF